MIGKGTAGFIIGGAAGIVKGTAPIIFATASGGQAFVLGTTYWACRSTILQAWTVKHRTPWDLVKASAISGGITGGAVGLVFRGRSNAIPGAVMFALFGSLGQLTSNVLFTPRHIDPEPRPGFWRRMSEKRFSPVTVLTNEEYAAMLREKLLKVEVEISIIDDRIAVLRAQELLEQGQNSSSQKGEE